jgi:predicted PurR-regulated permease PerM
MSGFGRFSDTLNRYLVIKSSMSLATGVTITIALYILGVDYPVLWGIIAFMLNFVPNIGSVIAAIPAVLMALVQFGFAAAGWVALVYVVVNSVYGNLVEPKLMGRSLGLSTLVVFASLVFWGWLLGPVGMFLSVPLTMTMKIAFEASDESRWLAVLLGSEDDLPPEGLVHEHQAESIPLAQSDLEQQTIK